MDPQRPTWSRSRAPAELAISPGAASSGELPEAVEEAEGCSLEAPEEEGSGASLPIPAPFRASISAMIWEGCLGAGLGFAGGGFPTSAFPGKGPG